MASGMEGVEELGAGKPLPRYIQLTEDQAQTVEYRFKALQGEGERLVGILDNIVKSAGIQVQYTDLLHDDEKLSEFLQFVSGRIQAGGVIQGDPDAVTKFQTWNDTMEKLSTAMGIPPRGEQEDVAAFNKRIRESLSALLERGQQQIQQLEADIQNQREVIRQQEALREQTLEWAEGISQERVQAMERAATEYFTSEFGRVISEGQVLTRQQYENKLTEMKNQFSTTMNQGMAENEKKLQESMVESIFQQKLLAYDQEQVRNQLKSAQDELKQARTNKNANAATIHVLKEKVNRLERSEAVSQATTELQLKGVENRYIVKGLQNKIANLTKSPTGTGGDTEIAKVLRILETSKPTAKNNPAPKGLLSAKTTTTKKKKVPELTGNQMTVVAVVGAGLMGLGSVASGMMAMFR